MAGIVMAAVIAGTLSLVLGIVLGHRFAALDARLRAKADVLEIMDEIRTDLNDGEIEIDGCRYNVVAVEFPEAQSCTNSHS